jgi:hypothetical protein
MARKIQAKNGRQQENGNVATKQMENSKLEGVPWLEAGWGEKNVFFDFFCRLKQHFVGLTHSRRFARCELCPCGGAQARGNCIEFQV